MSTPFEPKTNGSENEELLVHHNEAEHEDERSRVGSQMRDMAARIPEQLSAIGRDISRTIERAISAKDDYMLAVKVSHDAQVKPTRMFAPQMEQNAEPALVAVPQVPQRPGNGGT